MAIADRFRLDGRVAVVTGASSGLGAAVAVALAEAGADVALGARRAAGLEQAAGSVRAYGRRAVTQITDVTDPAQCEALAEAALAALGRVDILVNSAGVATAVPALKETPTEFDDAVRVNLHGTYWMAQACARRMGEGASIINVSSISGITTTGLPQAAYSASKAGVLGLTRDLAQQWSGRRGIRVNALVPGFFKSELTSVTNPAFVERTEQRALMGRWATLDDLLPAVIFLAGDASSFMTGQALVIDGGITIA